MGSEIVSDQENGTQAALTFWKSVSMTLLAFVLGNAIAFFTFGIRAASKDDLDKAMMALQARLSTLEAHDASVEMEMSNLVGQLQAKHIATAPQKQ